MLAGCRSWDSGTPAGAANAAPAGAPPSGHIHGAFVAAGLAGGGACLRHRARELGVVSGVPRPHPARRVADIGAVGVGADACGQLGHHVLTEAGVGAGRASLGALEAGVDAFLQLWRPAPPRFFG